MALGKVRSYTPKLNNIQKKAYQNALKIAATRIPTMSAKRQRVTKKKQRATATLVR